MLTIDDLRHHQSNWVEPISVRYRNHQVFNVPPNSQGFASLSILNILNQFPLSNVEEGSADYYHLLAEATKRAFVDVINT